jgi:FAD/FMN-containing dehydrogenase
MIGSLTPAMKGAARMQAPGHRSTISGAAIPGVGRRRFLSVGGGVLAGAGALTLGRSAHGSLGVTGAGQSAVPVLGPIYPADPRYATMCMGFNQRWVGSPAYVQVICSARQAVHAVQQAVDAGLRITVRGGGHCDENFSAGNDGGAIMDMSGMQGIYVDPAGQVAVEGGATLWNVYEALFKDYNLALPGGSCYSVGVGGHVAGGGYGLLSRLHGLTVDYLAGVDVVCVNRRGKARLVHARKDDPVTAQLLWAHTGGGGGNFGIVTTYYFTGLPNPPGQVQLATSTWPWSALTAADFATLLRNFGGFMQANSSPSSPYAGLFANLHAFHRSAGHISMTTQAAGPAFSLLETFLTQINAGVPGGSTATRTLPWLQATQTLNTSGPNQRTKHKSAYMIAPFPEGQIQAIYSALTDTHFANPQAEVQIDSYGGQVNAVAPQATAAAQRSSIMKLQYHTSWAQPQDDDANLNWIRSFYTSVYSDTGGVPASNQITDGCYINYPDVDLPATWPTLYYKNGYPALQAVKAQWDPLNVFNHTQSITAVTQNS